VTINDNRWPSGAAGSFGRQDPTPARIHMLSSIRLRGVAFAAILFVAIPCAFAEGPIVAKPEEAGFTSAGLSHRCLHQERDRRKQDSGRHEILRVKRFATRLTRTTLAKEVL
jgi:hypothetical protein